LKLFKLVKLQTSFKRLQGSEFLSFKGQHLLEKKMRLGAQPSFSLFSEESRKVILAWPLISLREGDLAIRGV